MLLGESGRERVWFHLDIGVGITSTNTKLDVNGLLRKKSRKKEIGE